MILVWTDKGMASNENVEVTFEPISKRVLVNAGTTVLQAANEAGISLTTECGGKGTCGKCRVIVGKPECLSELTDSERRHLSTFEVSQGYRLACQAKVLRSTTIMLPAESHLGTRRFQATGLERVLTPKPAVKKVHVKMSKPTLSDIRPDYERLVDALPPIYQQAEVAHEVLKEIPTIIRQSNFDVTATIWSGRRIISVESGDTSEKVFGLAVDIGTSKIVCHLVDLVNGKTLDIESAENPQLVYGEDIISRITFATADPKNLETLQKALVNVINKIVGKICRRQGIERGQIYEAVVVGNTAMHHLFLGIQPKYVALSPFTPAVKKQLNVEASKLKIRIKPSGIVTILPVIAGFVGADAVADALASGICDSEDVSMLIDVGTNTEVLVGNSQDVIACSCASGPAFEGFHIRHGVKAVEGAIEKVRIREDFEVEYETIGRKKPIGLCGSAMIDLVAEMFKRGLIDSGGRINLNMKTERLRKRNGEIEFVVAWGGETKTGRDITITQGDIREVQLAKAAIYAACSILMEKKGLKEDDFDRVFVAGAFGNYLNLENAKVLGLIPDIPLEKIEFIGNAAITGAKMALISVEAREKADEISRKTRYVELAADQNFNKEFIDATLIPHKNLNKFPSVKRLLKGG
ncbi:MAG: ASKHA domain-containing protein [Candidatus Bathyarchaeia archaeon]